MIRNHSRVTSAHGSSPLVQVGVLWKQAEAFHTAISLTALALLCLLALVALSW